MNTIYQEVVMSLVRKLFAIIGASLITYGWVTGTLWSQFVELATPAIAAIVVSAVWGVLATIRKRQELLVARESPPDRSLDDIAKRAAVGLAPKVTTAAVLLLCSTMTWGACAKGNLLHLASIANKEFADGTEKLQLQIDAGHARQCGLEPPNGPGTLQPCISDAEYNRWRARFIQGGQIGIQFTDALDKADKGGVVNQGTALLGFVQGLLDDEALKLPPDTRLTAISVLMGIKAALATFAPAPPPAPIPPKE